VLSEIERDGCTLEQALELDLVDLFVEFCHFLAIFAMPTMSIGTINSWKYSALFALSSFKAGVLQRPVNGIISSSTVQDMFDYLQAHCTVRDSIKQAQPMFPQDIERMLNVCNYDFFGLRDRLVFHCAYKRALRAFSVVNCKPHDVGIFEEDGQTVFEITFVTFKGTRGSNALTTKLTLYDEWARIACLYDKLFRRIHCNPDLHIDAQPYFGFNSAEAFTKRVYDVCKFAGYPTKFFSGHSFRCGSVTFEACEKCHGAENLDRFFQVFDTNRVLGGWMGDKIKLYIRDQVTKLQERRIRPSEMTVHQLRAGNGITINLPVLMQVFLGKVNTFLAAASMRAWYGCFGIEFFDNIEPNEQQINAVFKSNASTFMHKSRVFRNFVLRHETRKFHAGKILQWLTVNCIVNPTLFNRHEPQQALENLEQALVALHQRYAVLLNQPKFDQLQPSPAQVKKKVNIHETDDPQLTRAHLRNRRRVNVIIADE
jgi:hypothetical protein